MSDLENQPKVISVSGSHNKPKVLSVSGERPKVIWTSVIGGPSANDAAAFAARYREYRGFGPAYGFNRPDLERMAQAVRIAPVRFIFEVRQKTLDGDIGHWMLALRALSPNELRVYDPEVGVRNLVTKEGAHSTLDVMFNDPSEAKWGPEKITEQREKVTVIHRDLLNPASEAEYQLNEDPLVKLGKLQRNPYDCGPLCVYAALVARKAS